MHIHMQAIPPTGFLSLYMRSKTLACVSRAMEVILPTQFLARAVEHGCDVITKDTANTLPTLDTSICESHAHRLAPFVRSFLIE